MGAIFIVFMLTAIVSLIGYTLWYYRGEINSSLKRKYTEAKDTVIDIYRGEKSPKQLWWMLFLLSPVIIGIIIAILVECFFIGLLVAVALGVVMYRINEGLL